MHEPSQNAPIQDQRLRHTRLWWILALTLAAVLLLGVFAFGVWDAAGQADVRPIPRHIPREEVEPAPVPPPATPLGVPSNEANRSD